MPSTPTAALAHAAFAPPEAWADLGQTWKVRPEDETLPTLAHEQPRPPSKKHIYFTLPTHPSLRPQRPERRVASSPIGAPETGRPENVQPTEPKSSLDVRRDRSIGSVIDISRLLKLGSDPVFYGHQASLAPPITRGSATSKPDHLRSSPAPSNLALRPEALPALLDYLNATRVRCGQSVHALELYAQTNGISIPASSTE